MVKRGRFLVLVPVMLLCLVSVVEAVWQDEPLILDRDNGGSCGGCSAKTALVTSSGETIVSWFESFGTTDKVYLQGISNLGEFFWPQPVGVIYDFGSDPVFDDMKITIASDETYFYPLFAEKTLSSTWHNLYVNKVDRAGNTLWDRGGGDKGIFLGSFMGSSSPMKGLFIVEDGSGGAYILFTDM
ncbi:MAG: hypothetical protein ABIH34_07300, partial [Nanoarchaeota archaeon]